jgi:hypothetical protein
MSPAPLALHASKRLPSSGLLARIQGDDPKISQLEAFFEEPTPGLEPGTPSLRVAHLQDFCDSYGPLRSPQRGQMGSELLGSGHSSGHDSRRATEVGWDAAVRLIDNQ